MQLPLLSRLNPTIYDTAKGTILTLNSESIWVVYNLRRQSVELEEQGFLASFRRRVASSWSFDAPDRSTRANQLSVLASKYAAF